MTDRIKFLIDKLFNEHSLEICEYEELIRERNDEIFEIIRKEALHLRHIVYGNKVFIRGLIEISNYCKNDCYYCGIRKSNKNCERYRLTKEEILSCCKNGYESGLRTFVMQGGEDRFYTDEFLCDIIKEIKEIYPDCAVTLSLGERSEMSYKRLFNAGADRYLLRHETADDEHYSKLHPENLNLKNRLDCLKNLKKIGYQVGCGMMVGSPFQNENIIAKDLKFIEEFKPDMCGIGPFVPHKDTQFSDASSGTVELTCFLLAVIRIIHPEVLLPSTTAMGTIDENGREKGILASANVLMPNLSPVSVRDKYLLYDNKLSTGAESAEKLSELKQIISSIGFEIVTDRGDVKHIYGKD